MPKTEMFYAFARKIWRCGAMVSITSFLLSVTSIFYVEYLIGSHVGMIGLHDKRMSAMVIWDWECSLLRADYRICLVGAIFAVVGAALCLMYGFGLRYAAPRFPRIRAT